MTKSESSLDRGQKELRRCLPDRLPATKIRGPKLTLSTSGSGLRIVFRDGASPSGRQRLERFEDRHWCAELHRLRGVFLAALGSDEAQIEASFSGAIRTAKEQKSISLAKRVEATYAEYRRQKVDGRRT